MGSSCSSGIMVVLAAVEEVPLYIIQYNNVVNKHTRVINYNTT